jgi:hypothetical protein
MKLIITESKRNRLAINWLEDEYSELKLYKERGSNVMSVYHNGIFIMQYNYILKILFVSGKIWDFLRHMFGFNNDEISKILIEWMYTKFGFKAKECQIID